nr:Trichohyalin like [Ipomoea batatas]
MAHLQLLKYSVSSFSISQLNSHTKLACSCSDFSSGIIGHRRRRRNFRFQSKRNRSFRLLIDRKLRVSCRTQDNDTPTNGEEPPESLFMKELKKRGMTPTSLLEESNRTIFEDEETKIKEEDGGFSRRNAISTESGRNLTNQREQSMALNSEGIEGLIPRAKLLLTLGGTFFLGFGPLILVTVAFFSALYLYFGPTFVHDGSNTRVTPPQYVDPYALLEEERISQTAPGLN